VPPTTREQLARCIDHSLLDPFAVGADIERHCAEAVQYGFFGVCVLGRWVETAADILHGKGIAVVGVAGFPFGTNSTKIKAAEAKELIMAGADEIDMVADLGAIMEGDARRLAEDIATVHRECRAMRPAVLLKVIIESGSLTDEQIVLTCRVAEHVGADFVKTSTGLFGVTGATVEAVRLMKDSLTTCRVKAAGGIRTARQAMEMLHAGAERIGASRSIEIVEGFTSEVSQQ